jgi:hypothetical protein
MKVINGLIKDIQSSLLALGFIAFSISLKTLWLLSIPNQSTLMEPDSGRYLSISEDVIATFFSTSSKSDSFFITPGYPLFLAIFQVDNVKLIVFFQFLLLGTSQFILFRLVIKYTSTKIAYFGLILFLLESSSGLESFNLLTETLFNFIFILFLYFFGIGTNRNIAFYTSGSILGVALIVRPAGQILLIPLFLMIAFRTCRKQVTVVLLIAAVIPRTWIVRNQVVFGVPQLSGIQSHNLLLYEGAGAFAKENQVTLKAAQDTEVKLETTEIGVEPSIQTIVDYRVKRGIALILGNPMGFVELHLEGAAKILVGPGSANIDKLSAHFSVSEIVTNTLKAMIILVRLLMIFLVGICIIFAIKRRNFVPIQFYTIVSWILVLISSGGASAYSRFRVPLIPLEIVIICIGLSTSIQHTRFHKSIGRIKKAIRK